MRISEMNMETFRRYAKAGRVVVFDTETTGISRHDQICQIAAAEYVNGELTRTMCAYVRPTCAMSPGAEAVHGLSMEFLEENGMDPGEAMRSFFDFLGENVLLVAHNNVFDMRMLRQMCGEFDLCFNPEGVELCDTLALSRWLLPELPSHALGRLLEPLGVTGENSHDAMDDVMACAGVFFKLLFL